MTKFERATQIWSILTLAAHHRQVLSYSLVGKAIGVRPHYLGEYLEPIQSFCLIHGLPPLTVLIVQEATGHPGRGFSASKNIPQSQAEVFAKHWLDLAVPKADDLQHAVEQLPSKGTFDAGRLQSLRTEWA